MKFNITDTVNFSVNPATAYSAVLGELSGKTSHFSPYLRNENLTHFPDTVVDAKVKIRILAGMPTMVAEMKSITPNESIKYQYISGDVIGDAEFTFIPDKQGTRVSLHWVTQTNSLLFSIMSRISPVSLMHSWVIKSGLKSLNRSLLKSI